MKEVSIEEAGYHVVRHSKRGRLHVKFEKLEDAEKCFSRELKKLRRKKNAKIELIFSNVGYGNWSHLKYYESKIRWIQEEDVSDLKVGDIYYFVRRRDSFYGEQTANFHHFRMAEKYAKQEKRVFINDPIEIVEGLYGRPDFYKVIMSVKLSWFETWMIKCKRGK